MPSGTFRKDQVPWRTVGWGTTTVLSFYALNDYMRFNDCTHFLIYVLVSG